MRRERRRDELRKVIDDLERRALQTDKVPAKWRMTLSRAEFRIALVEAFTAGKVKQAKCSSTRPARRGKKRAS